MVKNAIHAVGYWLIFYGLSVLIQYFGFHLDHPAEVAFWLTIGLLCCFEFKALQRNIKSPLHLVSAGEVDELVKYIHSTPFHWQRGANGEIVGTIDCGLGRFYTLEWHPNNQLVATSVRVGVGCRSVERNMIEFQSDDERAQTLQRVFEVLALPPTTRAADPVQK